MIALVTGQRTFTNNLLLCGALGDLHLEKRITVLAHGDADGADTLADAWADRNGVLRAKYPYIRKLGKAGGPVRNRGMLAHSRPDVVVAFFNDRTQSRGTADMVRQAEKAGVRVLEYEG